MADTYEAFYNGKPLNPNRGLPTMTYAQAEDCGLTESERLWCRTDGEYTPVTADDIPYDSNTSVKDKIDDVDSSMAWKWVGSASGTSEINLPQTWKELVAQVRTNNANLNTFHLYNIQRDSMDATSFGNYGTSYAIGYISKTKIRISSVNWAGQDSTANSILYVYYR